TKATESHTINVNLDGLHNDDSSLASIVAQINQVAGVKAEITSDNKLKLAAESSETRLAFENDTSGLLAAIGINTFFTGSNASTIAVNDVVAADGSKFAASTQGVGVNVENGLRLIALHDAGLTSLSGNSITGLYDQLIN